MPSGGVAVRGATSVPREWDIARACHHGRTAGPRRRPRSRTKRGRRPAATRRNAGCRGSCCDAHLARPPNMPCPPRLLPSQPEVKR
eukprot:scaffold5520_cov102-Isochrysis_galbana.AAC.4